MRKFTFVFILLVLACLPLVADAGPLDEKDAYIFYDDITFNPRADANDTKEGTVFYDSDTDTLKYRNASAWVSLTSGTGDNTLDAAYDQGGAGVGKKINVDTGAVELEVADTKNNPALHLDCNNSTNDPTALLIENAADAANAITIDIDAQTTGRDIEGTGASWYTEGDGSIVGTDLDLTGSGGITLANDETISNNTDTEIKFASDTEDFSIDILNNEIDFKSSSGVVTVGWGDLDAFTGLNTVAFDAAASSISLAADGAGDDLTVSVTGAQNASLVLSSAGTNADALQVTASAGGIDISASGAAAGEDIDIVSTGSSVHIEATEAAADAIVLNASTAVGGIDITSNADIDITTTGTAGEDITIDNTGGSINIIADENQANSIVIDAENAAGGIDLDYGTGDFVVVGTGADAAFTLDTDDISIDCTDSSNISITSSEGGEDLTISQIGANDSSILITAAGTGADAVGISAAAGTVKISGDLLDVDTTGDANITVTSSGAGEDLLLTQSGANDSSITLTAAGTGADAIGLLPTGTGGGLSIDTTDGAVAIVADGAANGDITIDAQDKITLVATDADGTDSIYLHANGGASEVIKIHADQGTSATSINLVSDGGGITLNAGSGGVVFTNGQTRKVMFQPKVVELDGTNPPTLTDFGTDATCNVSALVFDADGGVNGDDICYISWLVPDGYVVDSARLNVAYTFDTAEDGAADEAQFDFAVNAVAAGEAINAGGTALADQTTVISDATADNGKLHITQYNIEVEDIAVDDLVTIEIAVDESASAIDQGSFLVLYLEIEYESTE